MWMRWGIAGREARETIGTKLGNEMGLALFGCPTPMYPYWKLVLE
jgi:hypothetical protein